jgi:predicted ATPase
VALLATALELADADRSALYEAALHRRTRPHLARGLTPLVFPVVQPASISPWFSTSGLPTPPTPLVGRENEVARAGALIGEGKARLLTLTGPGGVGKTRLALAIASACREFFPDDVVFVPLASLSQPALLAATLARAVGASSEGGDQPGQATIACLRAKHMLLVLDNFERLLPAAQFIADLLASCPHLVILVTSRAILQVQGEQTLPVAPLVLPSTSAFPAKAGCQVTQAELEALAASPAMALFAQRAQAVRPEFTLTPENVVDVARICQRLDGLPLALELAAARIRLMPPHALLIRLRRRLPLLTGGARDLPERHQTLRAALEWSYDLLPAATQTLFRRLSVFAGGATLEAIEALQGNSPDMDELDALSALVDHSLVRSWGEVAGEPRYRMLQTIREYAGDLLTASGERDALEGAHAVYYRALAEHADAELRGTEQERWVERLEAEVDNLRAALRWSLNNAEWDVGFRLGGALWYFWFLTRRVSEGYGWLNALLASPGSLPAPAVRAKAIVGASWLAYCQGAFDEASALAQEGLALYDRLGDPSGRADALTTLACVAIDQGDGARARPFAEESLSLRRAQGDTWAIGVSLNNLGCLASAEGDKLQARDYFTQYLELSRALGDTRGVARSLYNLGEVVYSLGDVGEAHVLMAEALTLLQSLGLRDGVILGIEGIAYAEAAEGRPRQAVRLLGAASALRAKLHDPIRPSQRAEYDQVVAALHDTLGIEAFEAAWAEGASLSFDEAIAASLDPA